MAGNAFIVANRRVENERRAKYCGTASIRVASLRFRDSARGGTKLERKSTETLKRIFREERGCRREDYRHHAIAIVSQSDLETALVTAQISAASLTADTIPYPHLEFPEGCKLECLQGCDRLTAADDILIGENKRWVVDLFVNDLSDELRRLLVEGFDYQKPPSDGEIYCKIREYQGVHGEENPFFEKLWQGRLAVSKNRKKNFDKLSRSKKFSDAFDALLAMPALLDGLRLSVVHQMFSMQCDEVIPGNLVAQLNNTNSTKLNLFYLKGIYKWWKEICDGSSDIMRNIDSRTVEALQGKAPGVCSADYDELLALLRNGHIFGNFPSEVRERIWSKVCIASQESLIPSLYTFFEDQKFLAGAADCMRRLLDIDPRNTIQSCLEVMFTDVSQQEDRCVIQLGDGAFGTVTGDAGIRLRYGIVQLWLAAVRMYKDLPAEPQKKARLAKARVKGDESVAFEFASLACRLGFESKKINGLLRNSPDRNLAKRVLLTARKSASYQYDDLDRHIQQIVEIFDTATPVITAAEIRDEVEFGECTQPARRYGIPNDEHHEKDKKRLFLPCMGAKAVTDQRQLTSFFATRSILTAFLGELPSIDDGVIHQQCHGDVYMADRASDARRAPADRPSWHLDRAMIRRELERESDSEVEEVSRTSEVISTDNHMWDGSSELAQQTEAQEAKLDGLRELCGVEQASVDELRVLKQQLAAEVLELRAEVRQLTEERREQQEKLNRLVENGEVEEERESGSLALVARNDNVTAQEHVVTIDDHRHQAQQILDNETPDLEHDQRPRTRFIFEELLLDGSSAEEVVENAVEKSASLNTTKVPIQFIEQGRDGEWVTTDDLQVDPADPQLVERVAAKYRRKNFHLFDTSGNNLVPKTCFQRVIDNGTNAIVVRHVDQIRSTDMMASASASGEAGRAGKKMK